MMAAFPNARLVVHPRGARHMAEPSRLVAGVTAVYGAEYVARVYGEIPPIAVERIIEAPEGHLIDLAGRRLRCLDTPGHARHHICIVDEKTGGIFTGDMFGYSYRQMDAGERPFIFPTTTPTQFEPDEMRASIRRLMALQPEAVYATHYSRMVDVPQRGRELLRHVDALVALAEAEADAGEQQHDRIQAAMTDYLLARVREHGCPLNEAAVLDLMGKDTALNTQGLCHWLATRGEKP
jgi:glyoxylase-like metal-dependent hydrolase (beta-lactamase superfamily II)